jgi:hypothetical protein
VLALHEIQWLDQNLPGFRLRRDSYIEADRERRPRPKARAARKMPKMPNDAAMARIKDITPRWHGNDAPRDERRDNVDYTFCTTTCVLTRSGRPASNSFPMAGEPRLSETNSCASMARQCGVAGPPGVFSLQFVDHILVHLYDGYDLSYGALQIDCGPARRVALHQVLRCCVRQLLLADISVSRVLPLAA